MKRTLKLFCMTMFLGLTGCSQLLGMLAGTRTLDDNPFDLDGKEFLTTTPFQKLDVHAAGEYVRPDFEDFGVEGNPGVQPHQIALKLTLDHLVFNGECKAQDSQVQVQIGNLVSMVEDRFLTQTPRQVTGQASPATLTVGASRAQKGVYRFPDNTTLSFLFGKDLYEVVTTDGLNRATIQATVQLNRDSFETCTASLVVKDHTLVLTDFR